MIKYVLAEYLLANTANHYRWAKTLIRKWVRSIESSA